MAAYLITQIEVTDPETFERYRERVPATIAAHGGKYLVRGGALEVVEGSWPQPRVVVLEFPTMAQAKAWYDSEDYRELKAMRLSASTGNAVFVEGV